MTAVVVQVRRGGEWADAGAVPESQAGSLSSDDPAGRQLFIFGWLDGVPGVWRSESGADLERGSIRLVLSDGVTRLADLSGGGWHELAIRRGADSIQVRFAVREPG